VPQSVLRRRAEAAQTHWLPRRIRRLRSRLL